MAKKKHPPGFVPSSKDYVNLIFEQNPWFTTGDVPESLAFSTERPLARHLWKRLVEDKPRRFHLILGPRRVGKTTVMYQTVRHLLNDANVPKDRIGWLRMDHPLFMREYDLDFYVKVILNDLKPTPSQKNPVYLFIDEITYAVDWDLWLKTYYDQHLPVRLVASSSATAALRPRKAHSGVGRWEEQFLSSYTFPEYLHLVGHDVKITVKPTLYESLEANAKVKISKAIESRLKWYLLTGGFPELLLGSDKLASQSIESSLLQSQRILLSDAVQSAIYKDIPQAYGVDNPMLLERMLYTLAEQIANLLSPNTLCQTLHGMSQPTFDRYLSYLERAFLVFTLTNYSGRESAIQKRGRKLYFVDSAVRNAALQRGAGPLSDSTEMGLLHENLAAGHLFGLCQQARVRLHHWRDKDDEVDLIYDHPSDPLAFEIALHKHHRHGIQAFLRRYPRFHHRCFVVSLSDVVRMPDPQVPGDIGHLPLPLFLMVVGAQTERELKINLHSM